MKEVSFCLLVFRDDTGAVEQVGVFRFAEHGVASAGGENGFAVAEKGEFRNEGFVFRHRDLGGGDPGGGVLCVKFSVDPDCEAPGRLQEGEKFNVVVCLAA